MSQDLAGKHKASTGERVIAFIVMSVLMAVFSYILVTDVEIPPNKMPVAIIMLAILGLMAGFLVPALLGIEYSGSGIRLKAFSGGAVFVAILYAGADLMKPQLPVQKEPVQTTGTQTEITTSSIQGNNASATSTWLDQLAQGNQTGFSNGLPATAYAGCYADYGWFGKQMVQSFWGTGATQAQAQMNANTACTGTCIPFGGYCAPLN